MRKTKKSKYQTIPSDSYRFRVWTFLHPDGEFMFFHTERKMNSMLKHDLIKILDKEQRIAQLTFFPKGKGVDKDDVFMNTPKEKKCVVCGIEHDLTRHHVVPKAFRIHFPDEYKKSNSHDILFVCEKHHSEYEIKANVLKIEYFEKYEIYSILPFQTQIISKINSILNFVYGLENMLYTGNIHWVKLDYKLRNILDIKQDCPLTLNQIEFLKSLYEEKLKYARDFFKNEASPKNLVDKILIENSLDIFVKTWRQHFVDNAKPKFLPIGWDVNREAFTKK